MKHKMDQMMVMGLLALVTLVSGCGKGNVSAVQSGDLALEYVAGSVDHSLATCSGKADKGFGCVKSLCEKSGGTFDEGSQECFCPFTSLFSTSRYRSPEDAGSLCEPLKIDAGGIAFYRPHPSFFSNRTASLAFDWQFMGPMNNYNYKFGPIFDEFEQRHVFYPKPFRISLYSLMVDYVEESFEYTNNFTTIDTDYRLTGVLGIPFRDYIEAGAMDGLFEPKTEYFLSALGLEWKPLSIEAAADFSHIGSTKPGGVPLSLEEQVLADAYKSFKAKTAFNPTRIYSPYGSGCASYCVASEDIELPSADSYYVASYKKIYQLGTPSARVLVVQEFQTGNVVGFISLNVAETISSIDEVGNQEYVAGYDRDWNPQFIQPVDVLRGTLGDPFQFLKK